MAPLKRKRLSDEAVEPPAPAPETTTRRATRQTSIPPLPILPDPEPRKRRRRAGTDDEPEAPAAAKPAKSQRTPPGMRGKENIPTMQVTKAEPLKQRQTATASASVKTNGLKSNPATQQKTKQNILHFQPPLTPSQRPHGTNKQPKVVQPHHDTVGNTKPKSIATSGPQAQPKPSQHHQHSSSPQPKPAKSSPDRNIDKVVLGNICFPAWYPSYYGKEVLGDHSSPSTASTNGTSAQPQSQNGNHHHTTTGSKDGAKGSHARSREPVLERLYVCPCCFKYSKELVPWWEHVRLCEAAAHVPGRKIYVHPKGRRTVQVPAPGPAPAPAHNKHVKGGKKGSVLPKTVEEVVHDRGEWSIWEVDGEKDVLFCQNLSLFAKLFLDNKSVFFDVTGFNYFLLVYTPPSPDPSSSTFLHNETDPTLPPPRPQIVGFFSKEKMSWDNNNLACILVFPPWQRKGLGSLLMGVSYEISRREGILGGPEKPISDLGKKGYRRFWAGEVARWLLGLDTAAQEEGGMEETVVDVETCSAATWIAPEDCLLVLREMGVVEDAGVAVDPRRVKEVVEEGVEGEESESREVRRVRVDKAAVRRWVAANGFGLERTCDPLGFVEGYAVQTEEVEEDG